MIIHDAKLVAQSRTAYKKLCEADNLGFVAGIRAIETDILSMSTVKPLLQTGDFLFAHNYVSIGIILYLDFNLAVEPV